MTLDDPLMEGEIFGPILPIITVNSVQDAIDIINSRPRPLALYTFSKTARVNQEIKNRTTSGGVCINDTMWHGESQLVKRAHAKIHIYVSFRCLERSSFWRRWGLGYGKLPREKLH